MSRRRRRRTVRFAVMGILLQCRCLFISVVKCLSQDVLLMGVIEDNAYIKIFTWKRISLAFPNWMWKMFALTPTLHTFNAISCICCALINSILLIQTARCGTACSRYHQWAKLIWILLTFASFDYLSLISLNISYLHF